MAARRSVVIFVRVNDPEALVTVGQRTVVVDVHADDADDVDRAVEYALGSSPPVREWSRH